MLRTAEFYNGWGALRVATNKASDPNYKSLLWDLTGATAANRQQISATDAKAQGYIVTSAGRYHYGGRTASLTTDANGEVSFTDPVHPDDPNTTPYVTSVPSPVTRIVNGNGTPNDLTLKAQSQTGWTAQVRAGNGALAGAGVVVGVNGTADG